MRNFAEIKLTDKNASIYRSKKLKCLSITGLLLIVMLCSSLQVYALDSSTGVLGLQETIDRSLKENMSIKLLDDRIELAELRYSDSLKKAEEAKKKYQLEESQYVKNRKEEILYPLQRKSELEELIWEKKNTETNIRIEVTRIYHSILLKQQEILIQQDYIAKAKNDYETRKKEVKLGTVSENSLLALEASVNEALTRLKTLERDKEILEMNFNMLLGYDLDRKVSLKKADLEVERYTVKRFDRLVSEMVESAYSVKKLQTEKMLAEKELDILKSYSFIELLPEIDVLKDKILNLEYSITNEKAAVELKIRSDYNNLLNLWDNITIRKLNWDKAIKLYETAKIRYDSGLITEYDLSGYKADMDSAQLAYEKARLDYYIAVEKFKAYVSSAGMQ